MNKTKLTSISTYFLMSLMVNVALFDNSFVAKAQRQAAPPKLEGRQFTDRKSAVLDKTDSSAKLKTGTYKIIAAESSDFNGRTSKDSITFKIKIESVSENGNIKARLYKRGGEGRLKGQVDENGQLQLEGFYIDGLNGEWNLKLKAVVEDDTLINGKYLDANRFFEVRGTFNIGTLEEEF